VALITDYFLLPLAVAVEEVVVPTTLELLPVVGQALGFLVVPELQQCTLSVVEMVRTKEVMVAEAVVPVVVMAIPSQINWDKEVVVAQDVTELPQDVVERVVALDIVQI
tara:strand:- start:116 stop:442 length:327 start_codon:yes stop_codon:yes gene_type:complete